MSDPSVPIAANTPATRPAAAGSRRLVALALVAAVLIAGMLGLSLRLVAELEQRAHGVTQTFAIQRAAEQLQTDLRGAGRQVLDTLASGDSQVGVPLSVWRERIELHAGELRSLVDDHDLQEGRAQELELALQRHVAYLEELMRTTGTARQELLAARRASAEQLEARISAFLNQESRRLNEREAAWNAALARQAISVALLGALALAAMVGLLLVGRRLAVQRAGAHAAEQAHAQALARLNTGLEVQVHRRTESLERVAAELSGAREHLARLAREMLVVSEAERRALAHALHDDFGQRLAALKINLQLMQKRTAQPDALATEAIRITDECIAQVRSQAFTLRPPQLDELGLATALRGHVQQEAVRHGAEATVRVELPDLPLADAWSIQVYRIVQEAVRNALTHGQPRRLEVDLLSDGDDVLLRIGDDGHGSLPEDGAAGMGLLHMRERTELSGGHFTTQSLQPHGTEIHCRWPLRALAPEDEEVGRT